VPKLGFFVRWYLGLCCITGPNTAVKGTGRLLAVLKFGFLSRSGGFVSLSLAASPSTLEKGYEVHGIKRRASSFNTQRVDHIYEDPHVNVNVNVNHQHFILHYGC